MGKAAKDKDGKARNLEAAANPISKLLFSYMTNVVYQGYQAPLEADDLWELEERERSAAISQIFFEYWEQHENPSFGRALWDLNKKTLVATMFLSIFLALAPLAGPIFLGEFVTFLEDESTPVWKGMLWVGLLALIPLVSALVEAFAMRLMFRVGIVMRVCVSAGVYRKSLCLSASGRRDHESGNVVNLMSSDAEKLFNFPPTVIQLVVVPIQIIVGTALLFTTLGVATFGGLIVVLLFAPLNVLVAKGFNPAIVGRATMSDKRVKIMNDILNGIRVVKFNVYEVPFIKRVLEIREEELVFVKNLRKAMAKLMTIIGSLPSFIFLGAIVMYILLDGEVDVKTVFVAGALFEVLRLPFSTIAFVVIGFVSARVSANRVDEFLQAEEIPRLNTADGPAQLNIEGSFAWNPAAAESDEEAEATTTASEESEEEQSAEAPSRAVTLSDLDLQCPPGSFTMVVGPVGAGKTSLLHAAMGTIPALDDASVELSGSIAYVPQQAWIINGTVRANILMGNEFDDEKYQEVLAACALESDLKMLVAGDMTEIGEKGINLSGGQKQRISIARSVYADRDVYLIDDPLSAVDAHVGKHIFEECVTGALSNKLRVMATNQVHYLPAADNIVVLSEVGEVVEQGSYDDLMEEEGYFYSFWLEHVGAVEDDQSSESEEEKQQLRIKTVGQEGDGTLVDVEDKEDGSVSSKVYRAYYKAMGGVMFVLPFALATLLNIVFRMGNQMFLAVWSSGLLTSWDAFKDMSAEELMGVYAAIVVAFALTYLAKEYIFLTGSVRASRVLHEGVLQSVMRLPMAFFDTTPTGRIVNRFSKDMDAVDTELPGQLAFYWLSVSILVGIMFASIIALPWLAIAIVPIYTVYYFLQSFFQRTSIALKRIESVLRSPVFAHFSESLDGATSIRAYNLEEQFTVSSNEKIDEHHKAFIFVQLANLWIKLRLSFLGFVLILGCGAAVVLTRGTVDLGLATMALSQMMGVTAMLNWLVLISTMLEQQMNSAERILAYTALPSEAPAALPNDPPRGEWPSDGKIVFKNVSMRYREGLGLVLRKLNLTIRGGEKIGIVGRTGSGKSSLMTALFRLVEIEGRGKISIDGLDIGKLGLDALRSGIAIIPQDPVLFSGTLLENIDPFDDHSEDAVLEVIKLALLEDVVNDLEDGLRSTLAEGGANLSVGQKQLICLARALLYSPMILVLDEATASVDVETDAYIQTTVREQFKAATTLTIAHRLGTIMDSDRILVLDKGEVVEFDSPSVLVDDYNGALRSLVNETGRAKAQHLIAMAHGESAYEGSGDETSEEEEESS